MISATAGNFGFFASTDVTSDLFIYNYDTNTWTNTTYSGPGVPYIAAGAGSIALFELGFSNFIYDTQTSSLTSTIYPISSQQRCITTAGNKIFLAGGVRNCNGHSNCEEFINTVDIYDTSSHTWSVRNVSIARTAMGATSVGNLVFFAGGASRWDGTYSSLVDIYDASTDQWTTGSMSYGRFSPIAVSAGPYALFLGGEMDPMGNSIIVDIYDTRTHSWSTYPNFPYYPGSPFYNAISISVGTQAIIITPGTTVNYTIFESRNQSWIYGAVPGMSNDMGQSSMGISSYRNRVLLAKGGQPYSTVYPSTSNAIYIYDYVPSRMT